MKLSLQRQGELFIFSEATLWSLFPVITVLSLSSLSPVISLTLSSFFSVLFFTGMMIKRKLWHEIKLRSTYKYLLLISLFLGIGYYGLIFTALQFTSPGNASIIGFTQGFFSFLFFHVFRKEYIPKSHIFGGLLMVCGALIILASNFHTFHIGDLLLILANAIAPIGNFYMQKVRKQISSETIMFSRSILSTMFFLLVIFVLRMPISIPSIQHALPFLLINGLFLLGLSKILWIEGIHRISVTKALGLSSIEPFFTLTFAYLFLQQIPTIYQLSAIIPIIFGLFLLSKKSSQQPEIHEES